MRGLWINYCLTIIGVVLLIAGWAADLSAQGIPGGPFIQAVTIDRSISGIEDYIDSRGHSDSITGVRKGVTEISITFSEAVKDGFWNEPVSLDSFDIACLVDGEEHYWARCDLEEGYETEIQLAAHPNQDAGPYVLQVTPSIPLGRCLLIRPLLVSDLQGNPSLYTNGKSRVVVCNIPGNISGDGTVDGNDIDQLKLYYFDRAVPPFGRSKNDYVDFDRSGITNGGDIDYLKGLLFNTAAGHTFQPWLGYTIGPIPTPDCRDNTPAEPYFYAFPEEDGLTFNFDGFVSFDPDFEFPEGVIQAFRWKFGDGTPVTSWSSDPFTTHRYSAAGTYQVELSVVDYCGAIATYAEAVVVEM